MAMSSLPLLSSRHTLWLISMSSLMGEDSSLRNHGWRSVEGTACASRTHLFVLCREAVLFWRLFNILYRVCRVILVCPLFKVHCAYMCLVNSKSLLIANYSSGWKTSRNILRDGHGLHIIIIIRETFDN